MPFPQGDSGRKADRAALQSGECADMWPAPSIGENALLYSWFPGKVILPKQTSVSLAPPLPFFLAEVEWGIWSEGLSIGWRGSVQGPECGLYSQKRCLGPAGLLCRLTLLLCVLSQVWTEIWVGRYQAHLSFLPLCLILLLAAPLPHLSPPLFSFLLLLFLLLLLLLSPTLPSSPFWVEAQFRLFAWALDSARAVLFPLHLSVISEGH